MDCSSFPPRSRSAARSYPVWIADADPSRTMVGNLRVSEQLPDGDFRSVFTVGPMTTHGITDSTGSTKSADIEMGPALIHTERIYRSGEI